MQGSVSYGPNGTGEGMPNVYSNQIDQRLDCLSETLEMPFKELWGDATRGEGGDGGAGNDVRWGPGWARRPTSHSDKRPYTSPPPSSS